MKHHFIPQFLLKAWADTTEDAKLEVFRLDLPNFPSSRWMPEYTAYEDNLYTLTKPVVAGVKQQAIETDFLQRVDSDGAMVLHKLSTMGLSNLSPQELGVWAYFIESLLFRTPDAASWLRAKAPNNLRASLNERPEEYDAIAATCDPPTLADFVEENFPGYIENYGIMSLGKLVCDQERVEKILHMRWWLWDFSGQKNHLFLADRPCIFTANIDDPDLIVALPIGPWKAFMATKTEGVASAVRQQRRQDLLMQINESSLGQAKQRVYARDASPRCFISNRLANQTSVRR